jgi:hypothetical protein
MNFSIDKNDALKSEDFVLFTPSKQLMVQHIVNIIFIFIFIFCYNNIMTETKDIYI